MSETTTAVTVQAVRPNPWSLLLGVLVQPTRALARLRGQPYMVQPPFILQPLLTIWLVNLVTAYLQAPQLREIGSRFAESRELPGLFALPHLAGPLTSPLLGGLINVFLGSLAAGLLLSGLGAVAGGESRVREAWSLALYASVPAQLLAPLARVATLLLAGVATPLLAPGASAPVGSSLVATALLTHSLHRPNYLLYLLDPLHLWSLGLLVVGLVAIMKLPWHKASLVAGGTYLLAELVAFTNAAMLIH